MLRNLVWLGSITTWNRIFLPTEQESGAIVLQKSTQSASKAIFLLFYIKYAPGTPELAVIRSFVQSTSSEIALVVFLRMYILISL